MKRYAQQNTTALYELNNGELKFIGLDIGVGLVKWTDPAKATVILEGRSDMFDYLNQVQSGQSFRLLRYDIGPRSDPNFGIPFLTFADCQVYSRYIARPQSLHYSGAPVLMRLVMTCRLTVHHMNPPTTLAEVTRPRPIGKAVNI